MAGRAGRRGESGRAVLEMVMAVLLVAVLAAVGASRFASDIRSVRETALSVELSNLRGAVTYYAAAKGRLPRSLGELLSLEVKPPKRPVREGEYNLVVAGSLVEPFREGRGGRLVDPFGNTYSYDPETGLVRSTTPGYRSW